MKKNVTLNTTHTPQWVWLHDDQDKLNNYAAFRLIVQVAVSEIPQTVPITVSASSMYLLWVNGQPVGRGPAREWLGAVGIDRYEIAPFLLPGENVISALCHNAGEDTNAFQKTRPGFTFSGIIADQDISTGHAQWEGCQLDCWDPNSTRMHTGGYNRFNEEINMRRYRPDIWERGQGDGWRSITLTDAVATQRPVMIPREIPPLCERNIEQTPHVVGIAAFPSCVTPLETPAQTMIHTPRTRADSRRVNMVPGGFPLTIQPGAPLSLVFDLGGMTSGVLSLEIEAGGDETIAIGTGDRLIQPDHQAFAPVKSVALNPFDNATFVVNATHGVSKGVRGTNSVDRLVLAPGHNAWKGTFNLRGFRFVQLDITGLKQTMVIQSLQAHEIVYPCKPHGQFSCSDQQLNKLWKAGCRTLQLCMADTYLDNPSRERQEYGEDGLIAAQCGYAYFGDTELAERFLRLHGDGIHADGSMESGGPWPFCQIIPAWTLLWIEAIGNHMNFTGDDRIGLRLAPTVRKALRWFEAFEDADGLLTVTDQPYQNEQIAVGRIWNFIDWQPDNEQVRGEPARLTLNIIYYAALQTAARILQLKYGARATTALMTKRAALGHVLRKRLETGGAECGEHALAYAAWVGLTQAGLDNIAARALAGRLNTDVQFLYFTLSALEKGGHSDAVVAALRHGFGPMLNSRCDTLGESYDAFNLLNRAVCQGVAAVPGYFLPRIIAGIRLRPLRERTVIVTPWAGDIAWAKAAVPTPEGQISVFWSKDNQNRIRLNLMLPNRRWKARLVPAKGGPVELFTSVPQLASTCAARP